MVQQIGSLNQTLTNVGKSDGDKLEDEISKIVKPDNIIVRRPQGASFTELKRKEWEKRKNGN